MECVPSSAPAPLSSPVQAGPARGNGFAALLSAASGNQPAANGTTSPAGAPRPGTAAVPPAGTAAAPDADRATDSPDRTAGLSAAGFGMHPEPNGPASGTTDARATVPTAVVVAVGAEASTPGAADATATAPAGSFTGETTQTQAMPAGAVPPAMPQATGTVAPGELDRDQAEADATQAGGTSPPGHEFARGSARRRQDEVRAPEDASADAAGGTSTGTAALPQPNGTVVYPATLPAAQFAAADGASPGEPGARSTAGSAAEGSGGHPVAAADRPGPMFTAAPSGTTDAAPESVLPTGPGMASSQPQAAAAAGPAASGFAIPPDGASASAGRAARTGTAAAPAATAASPDARAPGSTSPRSASAGIAAATGSPNDGRKPGGGGMPSPLPPGGSTGPAQQAVAPAPTETPQASARPPAGDEGNGIAPSAAPPGPPGAATGLQQQAGASPPSTPGAAAARPAADAPVLAEAAERRDTAAGTANDDPSGLAGIAVLAAPTVDLAAAPSANSVAPRAAAAPSVTQPVAQQVAPVAVALATGPDNASRLTVALAPAELGRVEISIHREAAGTAAIHVMAERPETLALLQRDAPELHRALQQAGVAANGERSLSFSLGGGQLGSGQPGNGERPHGGDGNGRQLGAAAARQIGDASDGSIAAAAANAPRNNRLSLLDLSI